MIAFIIATLAAAALLADARPAHAETGDWTKIYDRPVSFATAIEMFDDRFGLAVIGQGIERTTDGGRTWHETYAGEDAAGGIFIADEQHAWVLGPDRDFLRTLDDGVTWTRQSTPAPATFSGVAVVSASEVWLSSYYAPVQGLPPHGPSALLHTTDGGATWQPVDVAGYGIFLCVWFVGPDGWVLATQCHPGDPLDDPMAEPGAPGRVPCADKQTLLHTPDGGRSWSPLPDSVASESGTILRIDRLNAYAFDSSCGLHCGSQRIYRTSDGGRTWIRIDPFTLGPLDGVGRLRISGSAWWLAVIQLDPPTTPPSAPTFSRRLAHSGDGGRTWEYVDFPDESSMAFDLAGGDVVASAGPTGISRYDPEARTWQPATTDAGPELRQMVFVSRDSGYVFDRNGALWATEDGGATWARRSDALHWKFVPDGTLWGFDKSLTIHLSNDGGRSTRELRRLPPAQPAASPGLVVAAAGDSVWLRRDDGLWRTDDAGSTWRHIDVASLAQYHFIDSAHAWTTSCGAQDCDGAIRVTSDGGDSWERRPVPANTSIDYIVFNTTLDGSGPVRDCYCMAVTHDGGRSWQMVSHAPWPLGGVLWLDASRAWGLARDLSPTQPPVVVSTFDGGATWQEEFTLNRPVVDARLTQRAGRLWLYAGTSRPGSMDGPIETPRRTLIYRRDVAATVLSAPSVGSGSAPHRPPVAPLVALTLASALATTLGASLRRRTG